jgi:predicted nucleic acid-binding protein
MTHGIDTDFLVAVEVTDHPFHRQADVLLRRLLEDGHDFALAPQTLAEFIHVVTDSRRMPRPLTMVQAISHAEFWWDSAEVIHVFPEGRSVIEFFQWLRRHRLGRKRLLDTLLAATLRSASVRRIITNNAKHYEALGGFEIVEYR